MQYITNKLNNEKKYKFSICTPCFNSSKTIELVYQSIKELTYKNFEWIVVNDFSTDNTADIIISNVKATDLIAAVKTEPMIYKDEDTKLYCHTQDASESIKYYQV